MAQVLQGTKLPPHSAQSAQSAPLFVAATFGLDSAQLDAAAAAAETPCASIPVRPDEFDRETFGEKSDDGDVSDDAERKRAAAVDTPQRQGALRKKPKTPSDPETVAANRGALKDMVSGLMDAQEQRLRKSIVEELRNAIRSESRAREEMDKAIDQKIDALELRIQAQENRSRYAPNASSSSASSSSSSSSSSGSSSPSSSSSSSSSGSISSPMSDIMVVGAKRDASHRLGTVVKEVAIARVAAALKDADGIEKTLEERCPAIPRVVLAKLQPLEVVPRIVLSQSPNLAFSGELWAAVEKPFADRLRDKPMAKIQSSRKRRAHLHRYSSIVPPVLSMRYEAAF